MEHSGKVVLYALGIFFCYLYFGILQERITRGNYAEDKNDENGKFHFFLALVWFQCALNCIFSKVLLHTVMPQGNDTTTKVYYAICSFSYLLAMVSSNSALQFVNYPTQVVSKSCKPIPVMLMGVIFAHKRYALQKYLFVLMIVVGVAIFIYKDKGTSVTGSVSEQEAFFGNMLLLVSLSMDGVTAAVQERMKAEHKTKSVNMMYAMNLWSVGYLSILLLLTGEIFDFWYFTLKYERVMVDLLQIGLMGALGQLFIFLTVANFGPLPCSIVTTTRKFFTVLGSVIIFGNVLITRQWIGTVLVFTGLFLDALYGKSAHSPPPVRPPVKETVVHSFPQHYAGSPINVDESEDKKD